MTTIVEQIRRFKLDIILAFAVPVTLLALFALILYWQVDQLLTAEQWTNHTDVVIAQTHDTEKILIDQETGERGYLVTGNRLFLQPYFASKTDIGPAFDRLAKLVADNPAQSHRVRAMRSDYLRWAANAEYEMRLYNRSPKQFLAYFNQARGKTLMDALRRQFQEFVSVEHGLRLKRNDSAEQMEHETVAICDVLAIVIGVALGAVTIRLTRRLVREHEASLAAVQKAGEELGATLRSIGDAVLATDAAGRIILMNPVAEQLTGWTQAEARGENSATVFRIVNETTRATVDSPVDKVIREGVVVGLANHTVLLRRGGGEIPIDDSGAPIRDEQGNLVGTVLVFRDISERRKSEILLAESESRFRGLFNANIVGIAHGNAEMILDANDKFLSMVGYSRDDLANGLLRWRDMAAPDFVEADQMAFAEMVSTGICAPFEKAYVRKDGELVHTLVGAVTTSSKPGEWMSFVVDLTERKQFETKIAALYQREHRIAESLQRALISLPPNDTHPGIDIETIYRAAWGEAEVGGDYFDVFPLKGGKLALVVGDVSGKGLAAAARTAEIKYTLRAYLREYPQPSTALGLLNTFLCESQELESECRDFFVVMTVAIIDSASGSVEITVGGAEPPLIIRTAGAIEEVPIQGLPLGIMGGIAYESITLSLSKNDTLLIATDGITEARRGADLLGLEGLKSIAEQVSGHGGLGTIAESILERTKEFSNGILHDDVCLVLARLNGREQ